MQVRSHAPTLDHSLPVVYALTELVSNWAIYGLVCSELLNELVHGCLECTFLACLNLWLAQIATHLDEQLSISRAHALVLNPDREPICAIRPIRPLVSCLVISISQQIVANFLLFWSVLRIRLARVDEEWNP